MNRRGERKKGLWGNEKLKKWLGESGKTKRRKHQGRSKILFYDAAKLGQRTCLRIWDCCGRFRDLRVKLDLQWQGGGCYLICWGLLDAFHTALTPLCCQILLQNMKLKYLLELAVNWFDLSVQLSNQQFIVTPRLSVCNKTCDECLNCQLWLMASLLSASRVLLSRMRLQPSEWRPQLSPLSALGCGSSSKRYQRRCRIHK